MTSAEGEKAAAPAVAENAGDSATKAADASVGSLAAFAQGLKGAAPTPEAPSASEAAENDGGEETADVQAEGESENSKAKRKRKKRKNKKNKNKSSAGIWAMSDEDFNALTSKWLEETKSQTEGLSEEDKGKPVPGQFEGYVFTGNLRPSRVTPQMKVPEGIPLPEYHETGEPVSERALKRDRSAAIPVHTPEQIAKMREICAIGREVLDIAGRFLKAGVTGDEVDRVVFKACMERGVYPSPLNYCGFPKSCCVSVNEVICHGIPDCRPFQEGDIVNLDISCFKDGFHSDLNETFMIGKVDEAGERLMKAAYESLKAGADLLRQGTLYRDIGNSVSKVAGRENFQVTKSYQGHGVGENFHQLPNVSHVARNKGVGIMRPGHIFTIEPMINEKGWQDVLWPDDWTACTRDGHRSAQFEHTFLITENGVEILTARPGTSTTEMMPYNPEDFRR